MIDTLLKHPIRNAILIVFLFNVAFISLSLVWESKPQQYVDDYCTDDGCSSFYDFWSTFLVVGGSDRIIAEL